MDRKMTGIGIGAVLMIGLLAIVGFATAQKSDAVDSTRFIDVDNDGVCDNAGSCQYKDQAGGFADANGDGVCDNIANCPMHQNTGGCHGSEGCPRMKEGFKGGCHNAG